MKREQHTLRPLTAFLKHALHSRSVKRAALGLGALAPAFAFANPTGGVVVAGQAGITSPDTNHTIINQASQNAIINWQQFSIGSNQYVQFIQPDSSAVVLNRVIGGNASQILGNLSANGQVFLVNPNGVFFGQGATFDVQGLVATTMDIKDSDFLAGHYVFAKGSGAPDAGVVNQGTLAANGGYIVLAGDQVENDGLIEAQAGKVVLAAGSQMTLTLDNDALVGFVVNQATLAQYAGVTNAGSIAANGGTVLMTAKVANALTATAVNNSGLVTAHSIQDHHGVIILAAQGGDINESGTLDASASESGVTGGAVVIRGNGHTEIASTASVNAAGNNADGGFVELSGHTLSVRGNVNLGQGGTLLIDPPKMMITAGGGASNTASAHSITGGEYLSQQFIQTKLNANTDVVLVASNSILASNGSVQASGPATNIAATGTGNLTLKIGTLAFNGTGTSGDGSLMNFSSNNCQKGVCTPFQGSPLTSVNFTPGNGTINLSGVTINIAGNFTASAGKGAGANNVGIVNLGVTTAKNITITGSQITVGDLTTSGTQGIQITANTAYSYGGAIINTQALTTTGGGAITLTQTHTANQSYGTAGKIAVNGAINAAGAVTIKTNNTNSQNTSGGDITVSGAITAGAAVTISASNASKPGGNVTLNGVVTGKSINVSASAKSSADINALSFHATGSGGVTLIANATGGALASGGEIHVTGTGGIAADNGGVTINAKGGQDSGADVSVTGNIVAAGAVNIQTSYSGSLTGSGFAPSLTLANVTGKNITINAKGNAPGITVGALTAKGTGTGSNVSVSIQNASSGNATAGFIKVNGAVKSSHGNVTLSAGLAHLRLGASSAVVNDISAAGNVYVAGHDILLGNVTAGAGGSINIEADTNAADSSVASVKVASGKVIKGRDVTVGVNNNNNVAQSGSISIGDVIATGTSSVYGIVISGQAHASPSAAQIVNVSTGNLTAAGGRINVSDNAAGGTLTVGTIQTGGTVGVFQSGNLSPASMTLGSISAKSILILENNSAPTVNVGALTATGASPTGNISVQLQDLTTGGVGAGYIQVNGAVKSSHGGVTLNADGTSLKMGASSTVINDITAAGNVQLIAHDMQLGGISAGGFVNVQANLRATGKASAASITAANARTIKGQSVSIEINNPDSQPFGGSITVGDVVATGAGTAGTIIIGGNAVGHPVTITAGNLTATTGDINVLALNGGGAVTVTGAIKTGGTVNLQVSGVGNSQSLGGVQVSGVISAGGHVNVFEQGNFTGASDLKLSNVTAISYVTLNVNRQNAGSANLTVGNINANTITVQDTVTANSSTSIILGALSAINASAPATIRVFASGKNNTITTGAIAAQGKRSAFTSNETGASNSASFVNPRAGATVALIGNIGGSSNGTTSVTVNGDIDVFAQAGQYTLANTGSHQLAGSGSTGQARLFVSAGAQPNQGVVQLNGNLTLLGSGVARATVDAGKVTIGGQVTITATAAQFTATGTNTTTGNNLNFTHDGTHWGSADLLVFAGSAAGHLVSVAGPIQLSGPIAAVNVRGGNVKTGAITVTGSGEVIKNTVTGTSTGGAVNFSGSRSDGAAYVTIHATGPASSASVNITGDINATGIGRAQINITGDSISTKNITAKQTAGHYTVTGTLPTALSSIQSGSHTFGGIWGQGLTHLDDGTLTGGMAYVSLQAKGISNCNCSNATTAQNVTVTGNITVNAVGDGEVALAGSTVSVTGVISGTALKANINGTAQDTLSSGGGAHYNLAHSISGSGGRIHVEIKGKRGTGSFNGEENYSGTVNLGGDVILNGPTAGLEIHSGNVTVKNVSVTGSGNPLTVTDVFTPSGTGSTVTLSRSGFDGISSIGIVGAANSGQVLTGNLSLQAPLMALVHVTAGTVSVGNVNIVASDANVTVLDTKISSTPVTFTAGDVIFGIDEVSGTGSTVTLGSAAINGAVQLQGARDVHLLADGNASGLVQVTAGRNVDSTLPPLFWQLNAERPSSAGGGTVGTLPPLNLSAAALDMTATANVTLAGGTLSVAGGVSGGTGDYVLISALGLGFLNPNLFILAGGALSLPTVNLTGNYAFIAANTITQLGPVTAPSGSLVQLSPLDNTRTVGLNATSGGGQQTEFTGTDLTTFNVDMLAIGNTTLQGIMTVGANGAVNLGNTHLILVDPAGIQGTGAITAGSLTLFGSTTADINLVTDTAAISFAAGHDIAIDNSAYTAGVTTFTPLGGTAHNNVTLLSGNGASVSGLLTAASITAGGGAGTVTLVSETPSLDIVSGSDVTLNNSAETGAAILSFGAGTFGNVSATTGGALTLGSGLNGASLNLTASGALNLGAGAITLASAATLVGAGITGTGVLSAAIVSADADLNAVNLVTATPDINIVSGTDITLNNIAETGATSLSFGPGTFSNVNASFGGGTSLNTGLTAASLNISATGALDMGSNAVAVTNAMTLAGASVVGSGQLSASNINVSGGTGAVTLTTDTPILQVVSGTDVALDNSAETGATTLTFGTGTFGNVSAITGGTLTLGSGLNGSSLSLTAPGALNLGGGAINLSSTTNLSGAGVTGTGLLSAAGISVSGGGVVDMLTKTTTLTLNAATDITLDNSAETGTTSVNFCGCTFGNVALTFGGDGVLGSGLDANELGVVSNNGSLDLSGATLSLTTSLQLTAKQDMTLSGVNITAPIMTAIAGGDISNSGVPGSITVNGLSITAAGNVLMPLTQFNLGNGNIAGVSGDSELLQELASQGLAPTSTNPNALITANGQVQLGGIDFTGSYLYLQGTSITASAPVSTTSGALIQFVAPNPADTISVEDTVATTADANLGGQQLLGLFPGATLAIGNSDQTGNVSIGANGPVNLAAGTNFVVFTTGTVTGLDNVVSTGLVKDLRATATYVPTTSDIDPSASSTSSSTTSSSDDDKKKKDADTEDTGTQQSSSKDTVTHDDSPSSVCHG